ncbi:hypothetical protein AB0M28_20510 [Streptomyces sp. NPDC051940]|uniref:hypothetical protein n=1 Tax=Streptomyces sp. NPDC051940 TaxID=3155675 RepID=UPI003443E114
MPDALISRASTAREVAEAAEAVRTAGREASAVLADPAFAASLLRSPRTGGPAVRAVARALTEREGLAQVPEPERGWRPLVWAGRAAAWLARRTGRRGLATEVAVSSLKLRVALCAASHPELRENPAVRALLDAVADDDRPRAAGVLARPVRDHGTGDALAVLAPAHAVVRAWRQLLDGGPGARRDAWSVVTGRPGARRDAWSVVTGRPHPARRRRWRWLPASRVRRVPADPALTTGGRSGPLPGGLETLEVLGADGRIVVRRITSGRDGVERYVVLLPDRPAGAAAGLHDLAAAAGAAGRPGSAYTRAAYRALGHVLPEDAEVALIGHGAGGVAAVDLAGMPEANDAWQLTHVVAVGAPVALVLPYDPRTQVITLVNEHDVVPRLGGDGLLPAPADWVEIRWTDPSYTFPLSHSLAAYVQNLDRLVPEERDRVDALLADYTGAVAETAVFRLFDR